MGALRALYWEVKMDLRSTWRYRFGVYSDLAVFGIMMLFFLFTDTGYSFSEEYGYENYKELLIIGYLSWMYSISAISVISSEIQGELKQGTFYRKYNSAYPVHFLFIGELVSGELIQTIVMIVLLVIARLFVGLKITFNPVLVVFILITVIGMYGIGLIVGGLSVFLKRTGSILFILETCLLFITDTIPTNGAIITISNVLPLTVCNDLSRLAIAGYVDYKKLLLLMVLSFVYLTVGILFFNYMVDKAKMKGNLLFY